MRTAWEPPEVKTVLFIGGYTYILFLQGVKLVKLPIIIS